MNLIHSLTAYKISFSYKLRNNPLKEELAEAIKNGEKPKLTIKDFLDAVIASGTTDGCTRINDFAFKLESIASFDERDGFKRYCIIPKSGKGGRPFQVYKEGKKDPYQFGRDAASLYDNIMYVYEFADGNAYLICHRYGHSGCKTIFQSVSNEILKEKGMKLELDLILPPGLKDDTDFQARKIILTCSVPCNSTDIADHLGKGKTKVIKTLTVDLLADQYSSAARTIENFKLKKMTKDATFLSLKRELNADDYNGAKVSVRIGGCTRTIDWDTFENAFEGKDITEDIRRKSSLSFNDALSQCSDEYIAEIRSRE